MASARLLSPVLAVATLVGLGVVLTLVAHPSPSRAGAPSSLPYGAVSAPYNYCSPGRVTAMQYPHMHPILTYRGRITSGVTASYSMLEATVTLDDGRTVTMRFLQTQAELALDAYHRKLAVEIGSRAV